MDGIDACLLFCVGLEYDIIYLFVLIFVVQFFA